MQIAALYVGGRSTASSPPLDRRARPPARLSLSLSLSLACFTKRLSLSLRRRVPGDRRRCAAGQDEPATRASLEGGQRGAGEARARTPGARKSATLLFVLSVPSSSSSFSFERKRVLSLPRERLPTRPFLALGTRKGYRRLEAETRRELCGPTIHDGPPVKRGDLAAGEWDSNVITPGTTSDSAASLFRSI